MVGTDRGRPALRCRLGRLDERIREGEESSAAIGGGWALSKRVGFFFHETHTLVLRTQRVDTEGHGAGALQQRAESLAVTTALEPPRYTQVRPTPNLCCVCVGGGSMGTNTFE